MRADYEIRGARVLSESGELERESIHIRRGRILCVGGAPAIARKCIDAKGLLMLPGIVDIHGDSFERQLMPRPQVRFDLRLALLDTDRQLVENGITTAFHGVTISWEPGLRSSGTARDIVDTPKKMGAGRNKKIGRRCAEQRPSDGLPRRRNGTHPLTNRASPNNSRVGGIHRQGPLPGH